MVQRKPEDELLERYKSNFTLIPKPERSKSQTGSESLLKQARAIDYTSTSTNHESSVIAPTL
jgi:hypothetical protein